jgi:hypothetical protein
MSMIETFVGKEVNICPSDTRKKRGIILEISNVGIFFKITYAEFSSGYQNGDVCFVSFGSNLSFTEYHAPVTTTSITITGELVK